MRRGFLVTVAAASLAAGAVLLFTRGGSPPAIAPTAPVAVRAGLDRPVVEFGDAIVTRIVVTLYRGAVRPSTLRVTDDLAPLTTLSAPVTVRTISGRLETVTMTQRAACFTDPCLARTIVLPRVRVSVASSGGGVTAVSTAWRPLQVRSRVTASDLKRATPRFASDTSLAAPSYRIAPRAAAAALEVVAALAAAGAAALLALEALAVARRRRRAVTGDELSRALRLVREAGTRPAPDRRRALGLLARLLRGTDGGRTASELAWSQPPPEPPAVEALVERVEREHAG